MDLFGILIMICYFTVAIAAAMVVYLYLWVRKQKTENKRIESISALIKEGANTFIKKEYKVLAIFASVVFVLIFLFLPAPIWKGWNGGSNLIMAFCYAAGTVFSAIAGKIGIAVST
jgi:K(+)-stimulated pyrophosphate-energized sodium pump